MTRKNTRANRRSDLEIATIIRHYLNGMKQVDIVSTYKICPSMLYYWLRKCDIPKRGGPNWVYIKEKVYDDNSD